MTHTISTQISHQKSKQNPGFWLFLKNQNVWHHWALILMWQHWLKPRSCKLLRWNMYALVHHTPCRSLMSFTWPFLSFAPPAQHPGRFSFLRWRLPAQSQVICRALLPPSGQSSHIPSLHSCDAPIVIHHHSQVFHLILSLTLSQQELYPFYR